MGNFAKLMFFRPVLKRNQPFALKVYKFGKEKYELGCAAALVKLQTPGLQEYKELSVGRFQETFTR